MPTFIDSAKVAIHGYSNIAFGDNHHLPASQFNNERTRRNVFCNVKSMAIEHLDFGISKVVIIQESDLLKEL